MFTRVRNMNPKLLACFNSRTLKTAIKPIETLPLVNKNLLRSTSLIGGQWIEAKSKKTFPVLDPATGVKIMDVPSMGKKETTLAIEVAAEAGKNWQCSTATERSTILKKLVQLIHENLDDLAQILTWECGKPLKEAKAEITIGANYIEYYAHECLRKEGFLIPSPWQKHKFFVYQQPIGVVALITPWNFPMSMLARKLAPALAAGCTAVIKPAEDTPLSALALCYLAELAGVPKSVINVITGSKEAAQDIGTELALNKKVRKLSFTGSTQVGKLLMSQCAKTVKKISLELGGNAPFIVFEDADIDEAVLGAMMSKFRNSGQTCVCSNRFFIHEKVHDEFVSKFVKTIKDEIQMGHGLSSDTTQGPMINAGGIEKTKRLVEDAVKKGAKVAVGGKVDASLGSNFFEPTLLTNLETHMQVAKEEIFGPIAPIFQFQNEEEVLELANDTDAGLAGFFYSKDIGRIWRVAEKLECGMVGVNCGILSSHVAPFGGIKESGLGREGSPLGMEEYLETKYICMGGLE